MVLKIFLEQLCNNTKSEHIIDRNNILLIISQKYLFKIIK